MAKEFGHLIKILILNCLHYSCCGYFFAIVINDGNRLNRKAVLFTEGLKLCDTLIIGAKADILSGYYHLCVELSGNGTAKLVCGHGIIIPGVYRNHYFHAGFFKEFFLFTLGIYNGLKCLVCAYYHRYKPLMGTDLFYNCPVAKVDTVKMSKSHTGTVLRTTAKIQYMLHCKFPPVSRHTCGSDALPQDFTSQFKQLYRLIQRDASWSKGSKSVYLRCR